MEASPRLRLGTLFHLQHDWARYRIRDPQAAAKVFEQGYSTKLGEMPGSRGWGLALTNVVCRRRGGDITLERTDDGQTIFHARLPMPRGSDRTEAPR